jgi:hypothetical protein
LSNGGSIVLADSSATNEIQTLSLADRGLIKTVKLSKGDSVNVNIADGDTTYWKASGNNVVYNKGSVGIGTTSISSSAALQVNSTTQGVLMPRMTEAQRTAISSPATGLLVYQTNNTAGFYYYTGTAWVLLSSGTGGSSGSSNNTLIYTTDGF